MLGLPGNPEGMADPDLFSALTESEEPRNPVAIESKASRFIHSSQGFQSPSSLHPAGAPSRASKLCTAASVLKLSSLPPFQHFSKAVFNKTFVFILKKINKSFHIKYRHFYLCF